MIAYFLRGGKAAAGNPNMTDATGLAYEGVNKITSRLMPIDHVTERSDDVLNLLLQTADTSFSNLNYFLGGKINVDDNSTSVHSAVRNSIWNVFTFDRKDSELVRSFIPNNVSGICYNHHNPLEPDWRNASWGNNYEILNTIKEKYDPDHYFNCWHCVGYIGEEGTQTPTPAPSSNITTAPSTPAASTPAPSSSIITTAPSTEVTSSHPCSDSPLRFRVFWNGRNMFRDCTWVANRATKQKCGVDGVGSMCPVTCGTCNDDCEDVTVRFKVTWNGRKISRDCSWVANRATSMRCNLPGVSDSCRSTCQKC